MELQDRDVVEITKLLIECAKERMKECNHLSVGNYVSENLNTIKETIRRWEDK